MKIGIVWSIVFVIGIIIGFSSCNNYTNHRLLTVDNVEVSDNLYNDSGVKIRIKESTQWYYITVENSTNDIVEILWDEMEIRTGELHSKIIHEDVNLYAANYSAGTSKLYKNEVLRHKLIPVDNIYFEDEIAYIGEMENYLESNHSVLFVMNRADEKKEITFEFGYPNELERKAKSGRIITLSRGFIWFLILDALAAALIVYFKYFA